MYTASRSLLRLEVVEICCRRMLMTIKEILLVDDDMTIRKVAEISLSRVGNWRVKLAESGPKAMEILAAYRPDVILLDVMMPGLDGPSTFALLQSNERTKDIPVIFLTAKVQIQEVEAYRNLGAVGVISKPFDPLSLPDEIRKIIELSANLGSACVA
jgi:two-component system, OmpR family, response regulator